MAPLTGWGSYMARTPGTTGRPANLAGTTPDQSLELAAARRRIKELETELAVSRKVNEIVTLLMRRLGLYGLPQKRLPKGAKVGKFAATDLVRREFTVTAPNRLWMTDNTEHPTREGKVYCCVVLDAFSGKVVGWSIDTQQNTLLVGRHETAGAARSQTARCAKNDCPSYRIVALPQITLGPLSAGSSVVTRSSSVSPPSSRTLSGSAALLG